uniref:Uncharacterized protein n=1 Tax=Helianthus annuus TaxID=4232 RepID=A0A251S092_HELAN
MRIGKETQMLILQLEKHCFSLQLCGGGVVVCDEDGGGVWRRWLWCGGCVTRMVVEMMKGVVAAIDKDGRKEIQHEFKQSKLSAQCNHR